MRLITTSHPDEPALDMALSHALLREVARGHAPETVRLYRPGPTMAFGRLDALREGYPQARAAAAAAGWTPVLRLGGGHAAAYDGGSVVLELVTRTASVTGGIQQRFAHGVGLIVLALADVGLAADIGELPGEYCAGRWSVHLRGGPKIAGAAQRNVRGASLLTAVVVVEHGARVRSALTPVYDALALAWDPATAGAAQDARAGLESREVAAAVRRRLAQQDTDLAPAHFEASTVAAARQLLPVHAG